jgi:hypothetical protein
MPSSVPVSTARTVNSRIATDGRMKGSGFGAEELAMGESPLPAAAREAADRRQTNAAPEPRQPKTGTDETRKREFGGWKIGGVD